MPAPRATTGTPKPVTGAQHGSHLLVAFRQCHGQRALAVGGEPVALIGRDSLRCPEQVGSAQRQGERRDHFAPLARGAVDGGSWLVGTHGGLTGAGP